MKKVDERQLNMFKTRGPGGKVEEGVARDEDGDLDTEDKRPG